MVGPSELSVGRSLVRIVEEWRVGYAGYLASKHILSGMLRTARDFRPVPIYTACGHLEE